MDRGWWLISQKPGLDYVIYEVIKEKKFPELKEGDFVVRTPDSKLKKILRWLRG